MGNPDWTEVSTDNPCPSCGKPDYCMIRWDQSQWGCRRGDSGNGLLKRDKNGTEFWLHTSDGKKPIARPRVPIKEPERADASSLDQVYRYLLGLLGLFPNHEENLLKRGLNQSEIDSRGYKSLPLEGRDDLGSRLQEKFGTEILSKVPGFYLKKIRDQHWAAVAGAAGIAIPVRNLKGQVIAIKVRSDNDRGKYSYVSSSSHNGPGPGAQVHVPLFDASDRSVIRVTEGELKADVATVLSGILTLSIPGVTAWRTVLPVLQALKPKRVQICFDSDFQSNPTVLNALRSAFRGIKYESYS